MCGVVCEEYELKPFEDIEEQIQDLADRDIVNIKSLTEIGRRIVVGKNEDAEGTWFGGV